MKKIFVLITFVFLSISLTACGSSNVHEFKLVDNNEFLTMVTSADYPPFEFLVMDDNNRPVVTGIDIELGKLIALEQNKNLRVIDKSFDFLIEDVRSGNADFAIAALTPTPERKQVVDFSISYFGANQV